MAYIDREDFCENRCKCNTQACDKSECAIWRAPTADVEEVTHGEWVKYKPVHYECSMCGKKVGGSVSNYCPDCGADMRGETNEKE